MADDNQAPVRKRREGTGKGGRRKKRRFSWKAFLLINLIPLGAFAFYFFSPPETQEQLRGFFENSENRAIKAGIAFLLLIGLSMVALPAFHGTSGALKGLLHRMRERGGFVRVLLFPFEFIVWLLWFIVQILFAVDALAILLCAAVALVLILRIVDPTILEDVLPPILK